MNELKWEYKVSMIKLYWLNFIILRNSQRTTRWTSCLEIQFLSLGWPTLGHALPFPSHSVAIPQRQVSQPLSRESPRLFSCQLAFVFALHWCGHRTVRDTWNEERSVYQYGETVAAKGACLFYRCIPDNRKKSTDRTNRGTRAHSALNM